MRVEAVGSQVAQRTARFETPSGELVEADERFFLIRVGELAVSNTRWTVLEQETMTAHRWWSKSELQQATEQVWPDDLPTMLTNLGVWT